MRDSKTPGLMAAAVIGLGAFPVSASHHAVGDPGDEILWTPGGTTDAKHPPRSKSTHKQNARKARKARKLKGKP